jgi:hypothetical protein
MLRRRLILGLVAALFALTALGGAPRAATKPAAVSAEEMGLTFEDVCTPDTFRPNEWVVIVCDIRLANEGHDPLSRISVRIGSSKGVTPDYFWMWYTINGDFVPVEGGALSFGRALGILEPGEVTISRLVGLVRMPEEGTTDLYEMVSVGRQDVLPFAMRLTATATAAAPSGGLLVTKRLASQQTDSYGMANATYLTTVTNQGSGPIKELKVTDRYSDPVVLMAAEPAPVGEKAAFELAFWDLASFDKDSLAPGESLVLKTTYGHVSDDGCGSAAGGVMVEATVGEQKQFYGVRPDSGEWAEVGDCQPGGGDEGTGVGDGQGGGEGIPGGGDGGPPVAAPATGEGPSPVGGNAWWMTAALAVGGALLVGAALALRRRARLGRRIYW